MSYDKQSAKYSRREDGEIYISLCYKWCPMCLQECVHNVLARI